MAKPFEDTIMYDKGDLAERIADRIIIERGVYIPYQPAISGAHAFDRMLISRHGFRLMMMDIKAISARNSKPEWRERGYPDTGISINHRNVYLQFASIYPIPMLLLFFDVELGEVYGNLLSLLEQPTIVEHRGKQLEYPRIEDNFSAVGKQIIYYPMQNMRRGLYNLSQEEIAELKQYNNYGYEQDMDQKPGYTQWKSGITDYNDF